MRDPTTSRTYFAALPQEEIGEALSAKVDGYYTYLTSSALVDLWRRSYYSYYGLTEDSGLNSGVFAVGRIMAKGREGELASIKVNHLRNLGTHLHVLTTQQKSAQKCRAINSDSESLSQAYLGDGLVDYYHRDKDIDGKEVAAAETAIVFGESFMRLDWDDSAGREFGVDEATGQAKHEGDIICKVYNPYNVIRDVTETSHDARWYICHDTGNRYDLAAKYSHASEEILNISTDVTSGRVYTDPTRLIATAGSWSNETDLIDVFEFMHKPTPSVPKGRKTVFLQDGTVLFDGALPFKEMPLYRLATSNIQGSPFGYTILFDLIGIQLMIDKLYTVVSSNQMAGGVQNFWQPPGNQLTRVEIAGGLNLLQSVVKPEVLELCRTPAEVFSFIERLEHIMEILSSISSISRGSAPDNVKSGTMAAYVSSQALIFSSGLQRSFATLKSDLSTGLIRILRDYCPTERQAVIAGKFNRPILKKYTGEQLSMIDRVVCEEVSAVMKTMDGRLAIADKAIEKGLVRNIREYINLINTGEAESLYESDMSEIILVKGENEDLRDYQAPIMLSSDDHRLHWLEHRSILTNDTRKDPRLVELVGSHMAEHLTEWINLQMNNPAALAIMAETPLPMPNAPAPNAPPPPGGGGGSQMPAQDPGPAAPAIAPPNAPRLPGNADAVTEEAYQQQQAM